MIGLKRIVKPYRAVFPTPAALVTTVDSEGRPNVATAGEVYMLGLYPLIVGKELNSTQSTTYNYTSGGTTTTYTYEFTYTGRVEVKEDITVPAGSFTCYKVTMRDPTTGDLVYTTWYSDEVKYYVKYIDYSTTPETTFELEAYSVQ